MAPNNEITKRVAAGIVLAAVLGAWGYAASRASDKDLKKLEKHHEQDVTEIKKSLETLESNSFLVCQFLDREDRKNGGPGIQCKEKR